MRPSRDDDLTDEGVVASIVCVRAGDGAGWVRLCARRSVLVRVLALSVAMMRRALSFLLVMPVVATSGIGQAWLLHEHREHPWHAHAIAWAPCDERPDGQRSPGDDHEHEDSIPPGGPDEGIVVVFKSEAAATGRCFYCGQSAIGRSVSSTALHTQVIAPSLAPIAQLAQRHCAHTSTSSRHIDALLRSNHALLI